MAATAKPMLLPARADLDYEDVKTGFMTGKTAALADWSFRKEQRDFDRQVAVLRAAKWAKENPQRRKEIANKYAAKPAVRKRQDDLARERRHARHRSTAKVYVCAAPDCRVEFCRLPNYARGIPPRWCHVRCFNRTKYRAKTAGKKKSRCGCCGRAGHTLKACPERFGVRPARTEAA